MGFGDFIEDVAARAVALEAAMEYRQKAKKYEKLVSYLEDKITLIDTKLQEVRQNLTSQHAYFSSNPGSAQGMIITTFDGKEKCIWKKQYESVLLNMDEGLASLRIRKTSAEQLQAYWEQKAEIEEAKIFGEF